MIPCEAAEGEALRDNDGTGEEIQLAKMGQKRLRRTNSGGRSRVGKHASQMVSELFSPSPAPQCLTG